MLRVSFICPKNDSMLFVLLGIEGSSRKWNILGIAFLIITADLLRFLWRYHHLPVSWFFFFSSRCFLFNSYQLLNWLIHAVLSFLVLILNIRLTILLSSIECWFTGFFRSQILDSLWMWTRHLWIITSLQASLMAFKIAVCPSQIIALIWIPNRWMFSRSSLIWTYLSLSVKRYIWEYRMWVS